MEIAVKYQFLITLQSIGIFDTLDTTINKLLMETQHKNQ